MNKKVVLLSSITSIILVSFLLAIKPIHFTEADTSLDGATTNNTSISTQGNTNPEPSKTIDATTNSNSVTTAQNTQPTSVPVVPTNTSVPAKNAPQTNNNSQPTQTCHQQCIQVCN